MRRLLLGSSTPVADATATTTTTTTVRSASTLALPMLDDATVMKMRPSLPALASFIVAQDGSGDFRTLNEAFIAAKKVQVAAAGSLDARTVRHRVDVGVKSGSYVEMCLDFNAFIAVYALSGTRGGFTLTNTAHDQPPGGVLAPAGSFYWEGGDIYNSPNDYSGPGANSNIGWDPKYPIHNENGTGTQILTRCTLKNNAPNSGGHAFGYGMDGIDGTMVMHDVTLDDCGANLHGSDMASRSQPMVLCFSKVTGGAAGKPVQFFDLDMGKADDLWLVDCNLVEYRNLSKGGAATVHISPSTVLQSNGAQGTVDQRTDWPVPVGGICPKERAQYGIGASE